MMSSKISVALATYNGAKYLKEQIDSIIDQTLKPDEIIVSDDNSTDDTLSILKNYEDQGFIKVFTNPDKGVVANFKNAVRHCKTDNFVALCDQDDIWFPRKNELNVFTLNTLPDDAPALVFSDLLVIDKEGKQLNKSFFKEIVQADPQYEKLRSLLYSNKVIGCTTSFNPLMRQYFDDMPVDVFMHDYWIALIAFSFGKHAYINDKLVKYRRHGENVTDTHGSFKQKVLKELADYLFNKKVELDDHIDTSIKFKEMYKDKLDKYALNEFSSFNSLKNKTTLVKRMKTFIYKSSKKR